MYFGGRLKCLWWKSEETFHLGIQLRGCGEQAIIASARRGCEAVSDFPLHHDHDNVEVLGEIEQA